MPTAWRTGQYYKLHAPCGALCEHDDASHKTKIIGFRQRTIELRLQATRTEHFTQVGE